LDEENLRQIFFRYGEERFARRIARKIAQERKRIKINSSGHLAKIVLDAIPKQSVVRQKIHPATRVFMALRIAVNNELEALESFMRNVADLLNPGGRLCVLSFHSLEDRIVKHRIKALEKECTCPPDFPKCVCNKKRTVLVLTKKAKRPSEEEIQANPMARSVRLRAIEKMA
jgi:16S rRNA (cytosine1402-N4)-methyltransferase